MNGPTQFAAIFSMSEENRKGFQNYALVAKKEMKSLLHKNLDELFESL